MPVTQFNMKWVEPAGLVKFDFLGLKTLTVLETAVRLVGKRGIELDLSRIPLDDAKTYEMLARGETVGVFQVESQGMRRALVDMRPDRFEDLIVLVALYRPGPMANIPTYCARKLGHEPIDYLHPKLEPILAPTYGIITYQEQVQQIARDLAGYTLGKADILRRAMGKKDKKEMASQRGDFISGAVERGIDRSDAEVIFDACAKFAEYGFNKSHSAPYALLTYQTAYLKANYPVEFLAASMTLDMGNTDKLSEFRAEAERLGIKVVRAVGQPLGRRCSTSKATRSTMRSRRSKASARRRSRAIVEARGDKPFADSSDFAGRINPRAVNKRVLESLAAAGAFDALEANRARAFAAVDIILAVGAARAWTRLKAAQLRVSFGGPVGARRRSGCRRPSPGRRPSDCRRNSTPSASSSPAIRSTTMRRRSSGMRVQSWAEFARSVKAGASAGRVAGSVVSRQERRTRTGSKMGIIGLSDPSGHYEAVVFSEGLGAVPRSARARQGGAARRSRRSCRATRCARASRRSSRSTRRRQRLQKGLRVFLRDERPLESVAKRLRRHRAAGAARAERSDGEVSMVLMLGEGTEVEVKLPGRFKVSPQIAGAIKAIPGVVEVQAL